MNVTIAMLVESLQKFYNPEAVIAFSVITQDSVEDVLGKTLSEEQWLSAVDEIQNQLGEAVEGFEVWSTLADVEDEMGEEAF